MIGPMECSVIQENPPSKHHNRQATSDNSEVTPYVSPTRIKLWLRCPLAYKLRYIDGIITPTTPSLFLGQMVHRGLEFYYRYRQRGVTLFPKFVAEHIRKIWPRAVDDEFLTFQTSEEEHELRAKAVDLVTTYLAHVSNDEPPPIAVEQRLEAPLIDPQTGEDLGISLVGIIDLVLENGSGIVITDFKTAARSSPQHEIIHELQLSCYSYLCRHAMGQTEHALEIRSLIKTKTPKVEVHCYGPRDETHFERLFSVIRAYLDAVRVKKFHIRPGAECGFCDYQQSVCRT
jgi:hypothetical protein